MNNLKLNKMIAVVIMASMTLSMTNAVSAEYYITDVDTSEKGNVTYAPGVTAEMTKTSYWSARTYTDADKVMMTAEEINEINEKAVNTKATNMYNLEDLDGEYNADTLSSSLTKESIPSDDVYIDGKMVDKGAYFGGLKDAISNTGFTGTRDVSYAICVKGADIKSWPEYKFVGYDVADTDDEFVLSSLTVNEPFVVKQKAVVNGHTFYWGFSNIVTGWVDGDNIAFCSDKEEWTRNWKVTNGNKDFIVVTQDKIVLEPSIYAAYSSEVKLKFGTVLKLVKKEDMPRNIAERATWNNYVVYLPTRNDEGMLETKMALISEHCNVSVGFLPMTQRNIIDVSLQCLGNRYGWGGMLDSMDCSLFTRNVYKCFGFELPRNTNWQKYIPGTCTNLSGMNVDEKQAYLETMPAGTLLYMRGHTMIYLGSEEHTGYVISDLGTVADSDVGSGIFSVQSVAITPLTVQRKDFTTWLSNLTDAVVFKIPVPEEETAVMTVVNPLTATILGIIAAHESVSVSKVAGAVLVLSALFIYNMVTGAEDPEGTAGKKEQYS